MCHVSSTVLTSSDVPRKIGVAATLRNKPSIRLLLSRTQAGGARGAATLATHGIHPPAMSVAHASAEQARVSAVLQTVGFPGRIIYDSARSLHHGSQRSLAAELSVFASSPTRRGQCWRSEPSAQTIAFLGSDRPNDRRADERTAPETSPGSSGARPESPTALGD